MADPTLVEVMQAMAAQVSDALDDYIDDLQVVPLLNSNPSAPAIDIYPSDPFQEQIAFGARSMAVFFDVRARVSPADQTAGQEFLLSMMDPRADVSVKAALVADKTLGGTVANLAVDPPSNFGLFVDPGQSEGLLGCTWRVEVIL